MTPNPHKKKQLRERRPVRDAIVREVVLELIDVISQVPGVGDSYLRAILMSVKKKLLDAIDGPGEKD